MVRRFGKVREALGMNRRSSRVFGLNSEHAFFFTWYYLRRKLHALGFRRVRRLPAKPARPEQLLRRLFAYSWHFVGLTIYYLTAKRVVVTPSELVIAERE
jgi:hypothetical protein